MLRHSRRTASDGLDPRRRPSSASDRSLRYCGSQACHPHHFPALGIIIPRGFYLVADQWRRRGNSGEINLRSLTTADVVRAILILKERWPHPFAKHGMSSYAPCTALGKPTESRHSTSPQRCYQGQPRKYLSYQGRPQDPRISPGQLLAKRARSPRRPNSGPTPKEHSSRIVGKRDIISMTGPAAQKRSA